MNYHVTIQVNPNAPEGPQVLDHPAGPLCPALAEAKRVVAEALESGGSWSWFRPCAQYAGAWAIFDAEGKIALIVSVVPCHQATWAECEQRAADAPADDERAA